MDIAQLCTNREPDGNRLATYRPARRATRSRHRAGGTGPARPGHRSPTTRPRCGCTRSNACSAGTRCSASCRPTSRAGRSGTRSPQDFFAVANEVSGRDLTWFFDQVYRSSNVFDYGVGAFERACSGARVYGDGTTAGSSNRARAGRSTRRSSRADTAKASSRSTSASSSRTRRKRAGDGTARDRWKVVRDRQARCAPRSPRSIPSMCCCST